MTGSRSKGTWFQAALGVALTALASAGCSSSSSPASGPADASTGALPTVTGPITGGTTGKPFNAAPIDLASIGYVEEEFFIEGNATAYAFQGNAGSDGVWSVAPSKTAHYKTRMLVRHPSDPAKFNGTVLVEWLNVSGGVDADAEFSFGHVELLRSGFAYVGVSAQAQGVVGGGISLAPTADAVPLVKWDPARYGSLQHPGDSYSYDIFTQAAEVVKHPGSVKVLGNLTPARLIGDGESQSAFRLVTYVDAIAPTHPVFDGFFIHSRSGGSAELVTAGITGNIIGGPSLVSIRGDLTVPVFQFETETDVLGIVPGLLTPFASARQPDGDRLHTWEVAGTAHADQYLLDYAAQEVPGEEAGAGLGCTNVNSGPQHWVLDTALNEMNAWMTSGTPPATGAPLVLSDAGSGLAKDTEGNALGGVRTAAVDVPIATYSGQSQPSAGILCSLFGSTTPLPAAQLLALYPTHDDYVTKVTMATSAAQQAGFILAADAPLVVQEAQAAPVPQ
jgi:hypothetical protein